MSASVKTLLLLPIALLSLSSHSSAERDASHAQPNRMAPSAGAGTTANLWVAPAGGNPHCGRSSMALTFSSALAAGSVCDSGPSAYKVAQLGDTVLLAGGTYTSSWDFPAAISKSGPAGTCNYNYPGAANLSNCITFKPAASQTVTFAVPNGGGNGLSQVHICADFIALEGLTFADTTYTEQATGNTLSDEAIGIGKGDSTCTPGGPGNAPHDIYLHNLSIGGYANVVGGSWNVWFVGGTASGTHDMPWNFGGGCSSNYCSDGVHASGIVGMTFDGFNFQDHAYPTHHMAFVHSTGGSATMPNHDITFAANRWLGGWNEWHTPESLEIEGSFNHILVENNYFDSTPVFDMVCDAGSNCVNDYNTIRFNTFSNAMFQGRNSCGSSCTGSINNNQVYGNINPSCPSSLTMNGQAGNGYTYAYNIEAAPQTGQCAGSSGSVYSTVTSFLGAGPPSYNLVPAAAQTAVNFVPASAGGWPATNIDGASRSGGSTNAGAS